MVSFVIWRKRSLALIRHNAAQLCNLPTFIGAQPCDFGKKDNRHCATFPSGEGLRFVKRCLEKISFGLFLQSETVVIKTTVADCRKSNFCLFVMVIF